MVTGSIQAFIAALETDSYLQAQLTIASPTSLSGVVDFACAKGYSFSKDELEAALQADPVNSVMVAQLRQYVGSPDTESGIVSALLTRQSVFRRPQNQPFSFR